MDKASPELDATRWVCNPTQDLAITIAGGMKVNKNMRSFDGRNAEVKTATTFVPGKTELKLSVSSTSTSATVSSTESLTTITNGPSVIVSTATMVVTPTNAEAAAEEKTSMAPIIGGIVGGFAALALIGLAIFLHIRRHKRSRVTAPTVLPNFGDSPTSLSSEKNTLDSNNPPISGKTPESNWQPTPATIQGTWTQNNTTIHDGYSSAPSEMPTPDMLGRDWTQQTPQQAPENAHEMSSTLAAAVTWGNGSLPHKMQGWDNQKEAQQLQGGLGGQQQMHSAHEGQQQQQFYPGKPTPLNMNAFASDGFPASLRPGRGAEHRAELA